MFISIIQYSTQIFSLCERFFLPSEQCISPPVQKYQIVCPFLILRHPPTGTSIAFLEVFSKKKQRRWSSPHQVLQTRIQITNFYRNTSKILIYPNIHTAIKKNPNVFCNRTSSIDLSEWYNPIERVSYVFFDIILKKKLQLFGNVLAILFFG